MIKGTIKTWNKERGFGFVSTSLGDMFLHVSAIGTLQGSSTVNADPEIIIKGLFVTVHAWEDNGKGKKVNSATVGHEMPDIHMVVRTAETVHDSEPVVDNANKVWRSHRTVEKKQEIVFVGTLKECERQKSIQDSVIKVSQPMKNSFWGTYFRSGV